MGHAVSNLALGVGQSFLCPREGVRHVFFINHISKCSGPPPPLYVLTSPKFTPPLKILQEPITWSLHMCCTLESTHSRKGLFLKQAFPAKLMRFRGRPHISVVRKKWRGKREIGQEVYSLLHHLSSCLPSFPYNQGKLVSS